MKTLKMIIGILLLLGGLGSLIGFFTSVKHYDSTETIGHLIALLIVFGLAIFLLKPKGK